MSHLPTPEYSGSPGSYHSTTAFLSPVLSTSLALPSASKPVKSAAHDFRKGRWTKEEVHDVLAVAAEVLVPGKKEDFEEVRRRLTSEAKHRSVPAIKAKYLAVIKKEKKKEEEEKEEQAVEDVKVEPDTPTSVPLVHKQSSSPIPVNEPAEEPSQLQHAPFEASAVSAPGPDDPPAASQLPLQPLSSPWTLAEDAVLLTTLSTLGFNKTDMPSISRFVAKEYERQERQPWTKSEEELKARWKVAIVGLQTSFGENPAMVPYLNKVSDHLSTVLAQGVASLLASSASTSSSLASASTTTGSPHMPSSTAGPSLFPSSRPSQVAGVSSLLVPTQASQQPRTSSFAEATGSPLVTWRTSPETQQQRVLTPFHTAPPLADTGLTRTASSPLPHSTPRHKRPAPLLIPPAPASSNPAPSLATHHSSLSFPSSATNPALSAAHDLGPRPAHSSLRPAQLHPHSQAHVHFAPNPVVLPGPGASSSIPIPVKPPLPHSVSTPSIGTLEQLDSYRSQLSDRWLDQVSGGAGPSVSTSLDSGGPTSRTNGTMYGAYPGGDSNQYPSAFPPPPPVEKADGNDLKVVDFATLDTHGGKVSPLVGSQSGRAAMGPGPSLGALGLFTSTPASYAPSAEQAAPSRAIGPPTPTKSVARRPRSRSTVSVEVEVPPAPLVRRTSTRKRSRDVSYAEAEGTSSSSASSREGSVGGGEAVKVEAEDGGKAKKAKKPSAPTTPKKRKVKKDVGAKEWHDEEEDAEGEDDVEIVEEPRMKTRGRKT